MGSQQGAMERKRLLCLVLFVNGCLNAPSVSERGGGGRGDNDHESLVELFKFVRHHLALDVQANRNLSEDSNNKTENIAKAIIKYVNDVNEETIKLSFQTLQELQKSVNGNLRTIIDNTQRNHEALEERSKV